MTAFHVPQQDYGAAVHALDVERPFMMREWRAVTREERTQTMPRVPRGVPSRKIPVKKPVVARRGVDGMRRNERRARSTVSGSRLSRRTRRIMGISTLVVFGDKVNQTLVLGACER